MESNRMVRWIFLSLLMVVNGRAVMASQFDSNIQFLAQELTKELELSQKRVLAVANFIDLQGNETELGKYLAEEFSFAMREASPKLSIIDRSRINFLLKEQGLTTSGLVDPKATAKLGKLAGVEALLTGIITPRGDSIRLTVKALDLETAITLADARGEISRTQSLSALFDSFIQRDDQDQVKRNTVKPRSSSRDNKSIPTTQTVDIDGFKVDLRQCTINTRTVACEISLTRTGKGDIDLRLYRSVNDRRTRIFDENGVEESADYVSMGQKSCSDCGYVVMMLLEGVTIQSMIRFTVANENIAQLALLELTLNEDRSGNTHRVKFRNVPLINS